MAYGMKYTKGGFPFKASPATYEKNPQAFVNRKAQEKYDSEQAQRISVDNPEHKGDSEEAIEARQNDHDVENGVAQTGAAEYNKKMLNLDKKKKKQDANKASNKKRSDAERAHEAREDAEGR